MGYVRRLPRLEGKAGRGWTSTGLGEVDCSLGVAQGCKQEQESSYIYPS